MEEKQKKGGPCGGTGRQASKKRWKPRRYINHKKEFIWFKNPKAGSTSILQILFANKVVHRKPLHHTQKGDGFGWSRENDHPDYFKFGFVRNPWDRLVSVFEDKTKKVIGTRWSMPFYRKWKNATFPEFAQDIVKKNLAGVDRHSRLQCCNLNNLEGLDFVGKLENFEEDVKFVMDNIGVEKYNLKCMNKVKRKHAHYTDYYDKETEEVVSKAYERDISEFGYTFGE